MLSAKPDVMKFFAIFTSPSSASREAFFAEAKISPLGFRWSAFCFGPFYALARGLWRAAALWVAVGLLLAVAGFALALDAAALAMIYLLAALAFGFEAELFEQARLERRGLRLSGLALGASRTEAEMFTLARADRQGA